MEIIGAVVVPVVIFLVGFVYKLHSDSKSDTREIEGRLQELEKRVSINEEKIKNLQTDVRELDIIKQDLTEVKINIAKMLTILSERDK